jgi:dihydrofolate reductase
MRKLVLYTLLSMDGVAESPDRYVFDFDEVMYANLSRVIETQDAVLLGRQTYDDWASYWPTSREQPFAGFINRVRKYVDELRLVISPALSGSGRKLFGDDNKLRKLALLRVEGTPSGALLADYAVRQEQ